MIEKVQISKNIYQLTSANQYVNSTIITTESFAIVVDTMLSPEDGQLISDFVKNELKLPIKYIINTHWHSDHIGGNTLLANKDTLIFAHRDHRQTILREKKLITPKKKNASPKNYPDPHITFKEYLKFNDGVTLELIHMPGHSYDCTSIYYSDQKLLITGDTVLRWATEDEIVIPYFYWGNSDDLEQAYRQILDMEIETIIPGHGKACTLEKVKEEQFYLSELKKHFDNIFEYRPSNDFKQVRQFMVRNLTLDIVFGKEFRHRKWIDKAHRLNLERLIIEKEILSEKQTINDWD